MTNTATEYEINLLDVLHFFAKSKKIILSATFIAMLLASFVTTLIPDTYTAKLKIIPHPQTQLVQLALDSESFTDNLVRRFNLIQAYGAESIHSARCKLKENTRIKLGKDGIIEIEVDDIDPERAAALVNAYPEELDKFITSHDLSDVAKQQRKVELRIKKLQEQLDSINKKLNGADKTISTRKLSAEKEKSTNIALLKAQLDFILDSDSSNIKITPSLDRLREQLEAIYKYPSKPVNEINSDDQHYLEYFGQAKYLESSIDLLKKRQALLTIDEQISNTQVLEMASIPQEKSKPKRLQIVVSTMLCTVILAILLLLLKEWIATIRKQIPQAAPEP